MSDIYVSVDIEADGPIPGPNSMLSIGCAAFNREKQLIATFSANLNRLEGAVADPTTMNWWANQPEAWARTRENPQAIADAMQALASWLDGLPGKPVFVGYPAAYDFMFVYWYLIKFVGRSPFSHAALDIKTLAMVALKCDYRAAAKSKMPSTWLGDLPHTHCALDDAIAQGELFCNLLAELELV